MTIPDGKLNNPSGSRGNEQLFSKPTFAVVFQAKLSNLSEKSQEVDIRRGTHLGKPAVYFSAENYSINLAQECKFTLIEKFYKGKPTMDEIRKVFIRQFQLIGSVKIAFFNYRHVYLDFTNELDYDHVLFKEFMDIGDFSMKILKWTANFKPDEETSTFPV